MFIRPSSEKDIPEILNIYAKARSFMAEHGNPTQWTKGAPDLASLKKDLANQASFVVIEGGIVIGTFALYEEDSNYEAIEGRWLDEEPYYVIHRIASLRKGVGSFILDQVYAKGKAVRIDTHEANLPMKSLLKKKGFVYCGRIRLKDKDDSWREAYEKPR